MTTTPYQPPPNGWRTFLIVWLTQSISVFGSNLTFFALSIWLTLTLYPRADQKPELAIALSAISLSFALPRLFLIPIAGAYADRHDRKRIMLIGDAIAGLLSLILACLVITHTLQLPGLIVLLILHSIVGVFHGSAFDASYAMIVPEQKLPRANGLMQTMWSLSGILSPSIAAAIIALPALLRQGGQATGLAQLDDGSGLAMLIDAATFFIAAGALIFLSIPSPHRSDLHTPNGQRKKSLMADVKEGARYIWHRRPMLWLLGTFAVLNLLTAPIGVFQPLILKFNLAPDWSARGMTFEVALATLATISSIGGLIGGVAISTWGGLKKKRVFGVLVPIVIVGLTMIGFGLSTVLYLTAVMAFISTAMIPIMNAHSQTIWQVQTPRELQGRVFAVRRLIAQFTAPLGVGLIGLFGGNFDPGAVIVVLGMILLIFSVIQLFNKNMLRVEDKEWLDAMAAGHEAKRRGDDATL
jgi:DHA3 family macrolide efflux protein-like MFS transporter